MDDTGDHEVNWRFEMLEWELVFQWDLQKPFGGRVGLKKGSKVV